MSSRVRSTTIRARGLEIVGPKPVHDSFLTVHRAMRSVCHMKWTGAEGTGPGHFVKFPPNIVFWGLREYTGGAQTAAD